MSEERITRVTLEEARKMKSETDWERVRAQTEDPPWDPEEDFEVDWDSAVFVEPGRKPMISLRVDADVLDFFRKGGKGYQTRMNAVLRAYKEAAEKAGKA
ncbi:BrnA antitoxin family protein [Frigidibacter oleivorans]|uniref:BrnA antitoxin family protein n=1 Tax=Frigidibacter oleivorans TaxID=2487129 RepID=UPI000F8C649A|nr:BrnA antitoxin family protein [Frigidibacter oleivorans]